MNLRLLIVCIAAVLALVGPALASGTSTIHGEVYGWDTFEPLENAVVEVNSTPSQSLVAKYGMYSFDLTPGDYTITARYYQNSTLIYSAEETVTIKEEGKYVLDLLLLPVYSEELMNSSEVNTFSRNPNESAENSPLSNLSNISPVTDTATGQITSSDKANSSNMSPANGADPLSMKSLLISLLLLLLSVAGYRLSRKNKKTEEDKPEEKGYISRKEHTTGDLFKPVKVFELSAKVSDKTLELSNNSVEKRAEAPHENLAPELKQDSQIQESQVKPSETASATEPIADPVKKPAGEPLIDFLKEPVNEPVKDPAKESAKATVKITASETPEEKDQAEQAELNEESQAKEVKSSGSEPQEKKEISPEKGPDKPEESPVTEPLASRKKLPLPADLQEVMNIIRGQGGRITQKDLRSRLKYSEGKVSLMLADLERRELIEKFKRGRGNVVILRDEER